MGLDPDIKKLPAHLLDDENPIYSFNRAIIDATAIAQAVGYAVETVKGWIGIEGSTP